MRTMRRELVSVWEGEVPAEPFVGFVIVERR